MFICPICKTLADNFIVDKEHYNCSCRRLMIILNTYDMFLDIQIIIFG